MSEQAISFSDRIVTILDSLAKSLSGTNVDLAKANEQFQELVRLKRLEAAELGRGEHLWRTHTDEPE